MPAISKSIKECIESCWACRSECQTMLYNHCLQQGGKHIAPDHVRAMADCIEICQTAADFMTRNSPLHISVCAACADICEACAQSCDTIDGDEMKKCAQTCRECAANCREMGKIKKAA